MLKRHVFKGDVFKRQDCRTFFRVGLDKSAAAFNSWWGRGFANYVSGTGSWKDHVQSDKCLRNVLTSAGMSACSANVFESSMFRHECTQSKDAI